MSIELNDIAGLSKPLTKLIEVVSGGIGTLYLPTKIRQEAKARADAEQIAALGKIETTNKARDLQLHAELKHIEQLVSDRPDLAERARMRILTREIEGYANLEAVADYAAQELPENVSPNPLDADWRRKFFLEAENVCDTDMQLLWGKILAGEVAAPGTFSLRTLDTLRQLSRAEAEVFQGACALAMADGWIAQPSSDLNTALKPFGLSFETILMLRDSGLLITDNAEKQFGFLDSVVAGAVRSADSEKQISVMLKNNGVIIQVSSPTNRFAIPALLFTKAGRELQRLIADAENPAYLNALGQALRQRGIVAKRGSASPTADPSVSVVTFVQDL
jgi:uncharacterized repeat protein (TIGR03899 family)